MTNEFRDLPPSKINPSDGEPRDYPEPLSSPHTSKAAAGSEIFGWAMFGIGSILLGTLLFAVGTSGDEDSAGGNVVALLGAALSLVGTLLTTVAVVAKGVQLGNRAS